MRQTDRCWKAVLCAAFLAVAVQPAWSQRRQPSQPLPPAITDETTPQRQQTMSRRLLQASYEQLRKDVERLFGLATELKEEVGKANEDVLPLSGVKKAEEIEKLAKKIQGRIKNL